MGFQHSPEPRLFLFSFFSSQIAGVESPQQHNSKLILTKHTN